MEISITIGDSFEQEVDAGFLRQVIEATLKAEGAERDAELGLLITGDDEIRQLNFEYRGIDKPTDVLSFAMSEQAPGDTDGEFLFALPPDGINHLGEVIISYPRVLAQALEQGHSVNRELGLLVVHGVLHLLGYDHESDPEADRMEAREDSILSQLGRSLD